MIRIPALWLVNLIRKKETISHTNPFLLNLFNSIHDFDCRTNENARQGERVSEIRGPLSMTPASVLLLCSSQLQSYDICRL